jgi:uroporphyrinogen-III synthase
MPALPVATAGATSAPSVPPLVLVTRPQPQADEWVFRLQALGLRAVALPLLGIAPPADPAPVRAAWAGLAGGALGANAGSTTRSTGRSTTCSIGRSAATSAPASTAASTTASTADHAAAGPPAVVMFVSPSAVERFFALKPAGLAWPIGTIAAGTGPGTRRALLAAGVPATVVLTPSDDGARFDSEALWAVLRDRVRWAGSSALIVRGEGGRDWLADTLLHHGAQVHFVEAYRRTMPVLDAPAQAALQHALAQPAACCWLFSSSEAVGHLPTLAPDADWSQARALATHPRIAASAQRLGIGRVAQVPPRPEAVAQALLEGRCADDPSIQSGPL